jgi:hypothetical protein
VFWQKRLEAIENKRQESRKEGKERTRGGKLLCKGVERACVDKEAEVGESRIRAE